MTLVDSSDVPTPNPRLAFTVDNRCPPGWIVAMNLDNGSFAATNGVTVISGTHRLTIDDLTPEQRSFILALQSDV